MECQELLEFAKKQVHAAMEDANSVKSMVGRWRIIKFRLEKLSLQMKEISNCNTRFLESYSLCREVLECVIGTLEDTRSFAKRCVREDAVESNGRLQLQSELDSIACRLNQHINDCDIVIKNSLVKDPLIGLFTNSRSIVHAGNRLAIRWAVRDLIARLQIGLDMELKQHALNSLVALMENDDKNVLVVAGQGGIPILVHMLDSATPRCVREKAASAVCSLARGGCCEQELVSEGVLAPLVRLLEPGTGNGTDSAAAALHALTYTPENARTVAVHGGIPSLVRLCHVGSPSTQASAAGCLRNIAGISELRSVLESEVGAAPALLGLIRSGTDAARECATDALYRLSASHSVSRCIVRMGGIEAILRFLDTVPSAKSRELALGILRNISVSDGGVSCNAFLKMLEDSSCDGGNSYSNSGKKMVNRKRLKVIDMLMIFMNRKQSTSKFKSFLFKR